MSLLDMYKKNFDAESEPKPSSKPSKPKPIDMPYAGMLREDQDPLDYSKNAGRKKGELALTGPHMLITGASGEGKGRKMLSQNILMWGEQPVVAMSISGDLVEVTIRQRAKHGPVYLLDLAGEVHESELQGVDVRHVVSDPCALIEPGTRADDEAASLADLIQQVSKQVAGPESSSSDPTWDQQARRPLAACLRAGGWVLNPETDELVWGGGIRWVLEAMDHLPKKRGEGEPVPDEETDLVTPNWPNIANRVEMLGSRHTGRLRSMLGMNERQRDSVKMNMENAFNAWAISTVSGGDDADPFHPSMLEEPGTTFYIVSPMYGDERVAASAVIEQTIQWWRRSYGRNMPILGMFLDELAQAAPLPKLPAHLAVLRKYGVRMVPAVQSSKQFNRSNPDAVDELREAFPAVLVLPNTKEEEMFDTASWFAGEDERVTASTDHTGRSTRSRDRIKRIESYELIARKPGTARLLTDRQSGVLVDIPDIEGTDLLD